MRAPPEFVRLALMGIELRLGRGVHIVGRSAECAVCIDDALASRKHAAIEVSTEGVIIRDLGSRNGVVVNGEEIGESHVLVKGDTITFGSVQIVVKQVGAEQELLVDEPRAPSSGQIARVTLTKKPPVSVEERVVLAFRSAKTLGHSSRTQDHHLEAYRLLARSADEELARGRPELAHRLMERPLGEVLSTLRAGVRVHAELLEIASSQGTALAHAMHSQSWIDFVVDLYQVQRQPMPPSVAERLAAASVGAR